MLARCATRARSITSCTEAEASRENPVCRTALMSEWSPNMESAWVATERAET